MHEAERQYATNSYDADVTECAWTLRFEPNTRVPLAVHFATLLGSAVSDDDPHSSMACMAHPPGNANTGTF